MKHMSEFYKAINYTPRNEELFLTAVTHSSYGKKEDNERMEFLGDAVLELISSELIFKSFHYMREGEMSSLRAELVCESALNEWAKHIDLGKYLILGKSEEMNHGRDKASILSDAVEAIVCAVYLDGGFEEAQRLVSKIMGFLLKLKLKGELVRDAKTSLQELLQKDGRDVPKYEIYETVGPPHDATFRARVISEQEILGMGEGRSKKAAEQEAAKAALKTLRGRQQAAERCPDFGRM